MGIQNLNQGTMTLASQIPFLDPSQGQDRRDSVTSLAQLIADSLPSAPGGLITQYAAPNATAFVLNVSPPEDGENVWLLITPTGAFAAGTLALPAAALCKDAQETLVTTTQAVAALTVNGNGSTVNGAPTTLAANAFFRLRFDGVFKAWYRVG